MKKLKIYMTLYKHKKPTQWVNVMFCCPETGGHSSMGRATELELEKKIFWDSWNNKWVTQ